MDSEHPVPAAMDGRPHFVERLRLAFEPRPAAPDEGECHLLLQEARSLLTRLLALEEGPAPRSEDDKELSPDLLRLERKLDLLLELLSYRLTDTAGVAERPVCISVTGAAWRQAEPLIDAPFGVLGVHLHRLLPRPLRLPVRRCPDAAPGQVEVAFIVLDDECEDLLVRYVFLQHRRQLAGQRRQRR